MAGRGTGLPTVDRGGVTPLADMSSLGSAERASADALMQAGQAIGQVQKQVLSPLLAEQGRKDAVRAVGEGRVDERNQITEYGEAYNSVMRSGTLARFATEDDRALDMLSAANVYDPDAFAASADALRSAKIKDTPGELAIERAQNFDRRRDNLQQTLRVARVRADTQESGNFIVGRVEDLVVRMAQNAEDAAAFESADPRFADDLDELQRLYGQIAENPVLDISLEEADRRRQNAVDKFQAAAIRGHTRRVFREQGPDAALAEIQALLPPVLGAGDDDEVPTDAQGLPTGRLSPAARALAYDGAMAAYAEESGLAQQRANIATSQRTQASQRAEDLMTSMRYGAEVDSAELRTLADASGDPGLVARARWAIEVGVQPPEGFGTGVGGAGASYSGDASAAGGFSGAVDFVIDQIEGGDAYVANDNGRGPTRFGINSAANPDLDIANLTRPVAVARYRRDYWDAIGADQLPPALALVAFDAAVNQGPGDARRWIAESGGDVVRYIALREADYRDLAARDPRQRRNLEGWLSRLENVRQRAVRVQAFQNNQDGFASDPLSFALGNANRPALASVSPLPVDAVFNPQSEAAWGQAIQARRATGTTLAQTYQVPMRYLTDGESESYRDRFERDPTSLIPFARAATGALGGQGARDLLAEVGQGGAAPVLIHVADLARPGGDTRFAAQAAQGLALKASGQTLDSDDRDAVAEVVNNYRHSFRSSASLLAAVQQSAESAALADRTTGRMREPDYYAQAAMGRTTWGRNQYGGGGVVNGVTVVVPRWLNPEYFDDALEAMASSWATQNIGPTYANGEPMPARQVARLRPTMMADGRYRLVDNRGRVALARDGSPYDVNVEAGRDFIRQRFGADAVRP